MVTYDTPYLPTLHTNIHTHKYACILYIHPQTNTDMCIYLLMNHFLRKVLNKAICAKGLATKEKISHHSRMMISLLFKEKR